MKDYVLLGRTGLRVSRLALGAMTFAQPKWGVDAGGAGELLDAYIGAGGNFIDAANLYAGGASEEMLGAYVQERGVRDRLVLATKYTFSSAPDNPNAGGNGRKNMIATLEASLRRLRTDYIDLFYMHVWDRMTPAEEVVRTFDDLIRSGKVRYAGLSDAPAWYAAQVQTLARSAGREPFAAMQLEYSLLERNIEREHVDMAREMDAGLVTWGPLSFGLLSGKYKAASDGAFGDGRLQTLSDQAAKPHPKLTEGNIAAIATLERVSKALGRPMAQVAVNWVANRPGVASVILGATKSAQLQETMNSLSFAIPPELAAELETMAPPALHFPYTMFTDAWQGRVHGSAPVAAAHANYAPSIRVPGK